MKYLILINGERAYVYSEENHIVRVRKQEGSESRPLKEVNDCGKLWNWIKDNAGWTKEDRQDVMILASVEENAACVKLMEFAKTLQLDQWVEQPTKWSESQLEEFLKEKFPALKGLHFEQGGVVKDSSGVKFKALGLYEGFKLVPPKPRALVLKKSIDKQENHTDHFEGIAFARKKTQKEREKPKAIAPSKQNPEVEIHSINKKAFKKVQNEEQRDQGFVSNLQKEAKLDIKEATDQQRHAFLKKKAKDYVFTVEGND